LSKASGTPAFAFMNHGGKRKGAGRKAKRHADGSRVEPSHQRRPRFTKSRPLHVTLEVSEEVPNLRAASMAPVVSDAIGRANRRVDFRVVHLCLLGTHVHLIAEADGPEALASGMKSLNGTIAKAVNKRLGRKGRVLASRFHLHVLRTKTEVRNAVQYVLRNAERHGLHEAWPGWVGGPGKGTAALGMPRPDPLSTAAWFPYWAERELLVAPTQIPASVVRPAECYLMKLAFEGAPLSFAAPMRCASGMSRQKSRARAEPEGERGQEPGTAPNRVPRQRRECRVAACASAVEPVAGSFARAKTRCAQESPWPPSGTGSTMPARSGASRPLIGATSA
jgi:REP element-mobilizing transposase RayT